MQRKNLFWVALVVILVLVVWVKRNDIRQVIIQDGENKQETTKLKNYTGDFFTFSYPAQWEIRQVNDQDYELYSPGHDEVAVMVRKVTDKQRLGYDCDIALTSDAFYLEEMPVEAFEQAEVIEHAGLDNNGNVYHARVGWGFTDECVVIQPNRMFVEPKVAEAVVRSLRLR